MALDINAEARKSGTSFIVFTNKMITSILAMEPSLSKVAGIPHTHPLFSTTKPFCFAVVAADFVLAAA